MGKQNPPSVGEEALLVVRPENLRLAGNTNTFPVKIVNRLFEGDRIDYQVVQTGVNEDKSYSMSVPFLPGTRLLETETMVEAGFVPTAGVVIRG